MQISDESERREMRIVRRDVAHAKRQFAEARAFDNVARSVEYTFAFI